MAYKRTRWLDHVVERPRTFTEITNADGSVTHTPAPGEVLQQGTPQSATNFNNIEEALQNLSVAFDMLSTINYALLRANELRTETLETQVEALTESGS